MMLLLSTGLRQVKNYLLHNKTAMIIGLLGTISVVAYVAFIVMSGHSLNSLDYGFSFNIAVYPFALIIGILFTLLAFLQADYMQISESEAHIYFVSPIKEHKILLYIFMKSSYQTIFMLLAFMQLNITFIAPLLGFSLQEMIRWIIWEALMFCTTIMFGLFLGLLKKKNIFLFFFIAIAAISLTFYAAIDFALGTMRFGNIVAYFHAYFTQDFWGLVPVAGLLAKASGFIKEPNVVNSIYLALCVFMNIVFIMSPYYIKVAMGEAAIEAAVKTKARREKKKSTNKSGFKVVKKVKDSRKIGLSGPWAIINKQFIEYQRSSRFLLSGKILLLLLIMGIYVALIQFVGYSMALDPSMTPGETETLLGVMSYLFSGVVILISLLMSSSLPKDISNPIIYLIPGKSYKKVLAISFTANFENLIKSILIAIFLLLMKIELPLVICIGILYFLLISTCFFVDMFTYAIFAKQEVKFLNFIFSSFIKALVLFAFAGIYLSICFITTRGNFSPISIIGIIVVAVIALFLNISMVSLSNGMVENK